LPTLPTTIDQEIKTNPFMRCDQAVVRQVAQQVAGQPQLSGASEVLAAIRAWKDRF
jgi:hydroxyacylglutathione hydrolase